MKDRFRPLTGVPLFFVTWAGLSLAIALGIFADQALSGDSLHWPAPMAARMIGPAFMLAVIATAGRRKREKDKKDER